METSTKLIIAAGLVVGGAVLVSVINNAMTETTPTKQQEDRFLQMVAAVYGAKHLVQYKGTGRTQPDLAMFERVFESEITLAWKQQNLRFAHPDVEAGNGYLNLKGRHGGRAELTLGSNF